jgi:hypothetical protein
MYRLKNMSRGGWIVVGIVAALLLVPTGVAVAAGLKYTGIEGTSLNKADVTPDQQLLTTEAPPTKYEEYSSQVQSADGANGGYDCVQVSGAIPAGEAFVVQQVEAYVYDADSPNTYSGGTDPSGGYANASAFEVTADGPSTTCADGPLITIGAAPDGTVGNVAIPLVPGYVVPSGYSIDTATAGMSAVISVTGYLVPSADAPPTPQIVKHGKIQLPSGGAS